MRYKIVRKETGRWSGDILDSLHDLSITWGTGQRSVFKPVSVLTEIPQPDGTFVFYVLCEEIRDEQTH